MKASTLRFEVQLIQEAIEFEDGRRFKRMAIVEKWKDDVKVSSARMGAPILEDIYTQIERGEEINLSQCYVNDFSLSTYRKNKGYADDYIVELNSFQASQSFFESETATEFSYCNFKGRVSSFAQSTFNKARVNFNHTHCAASLNFNHAEFHAEEVSFKFAEFEEGDVRFTGAIFDCENVLFVNTRFGEGNVNFRQADFKWSNVNFQYSSFDLGDVSFDKAIFRGETLDFRKIEFGTGKAEFRRVDFGDGNINFSESEFKEGRINFRHSIFGDGEKKFEMVSFGNNQVSFDGAKFGNGILSFKGSSFDELILTDCSLEGHCDFRIEKGNLLDLSYSIVRDIVDLKSGEHPVALNTWKFDGLKNMGKIFISWEENHAFELIDSQKDSSLAAKASQFNLLKESFHQNGKYNSEDKAYVAFKRFEMKAHLQAGLKRKGTRALRARLFYGFQWLIFDKAGLFATAPLRVFTSMIFVLSFFAILYTILPNFVHAEIVSSVGDPDQLNIVEKSFYHSAITFFTIGYGDYYPSGHVRWLSAVEGWAGVFLMSYFTVAFVRKILR